ncbi:hypothetical protein B0I35DRAFT_502588 [Stachybotrys elegans]|uniref:AA1-like domain-containing protein n=1 Tax=Stachybotrys elegans TaxID=80388 RepID=A0A8K0WS23_9HYPO|nr:hypothetical protein B0I35DRAFT_502588 [Stachybotrys elegans]
MRFIPFTAITAALAAMQAAALPTETTDQVSGDTSPVPTSPLEKRADAIFTLGYSLCSMWNGSSTIVSQNAFNWPGQSDVGCTEHNNSPSYVASYTSDFFNMKVCGISTNFYKKGDNFDFYQDGGDGTLLGTCYPYQGPNRLCPLIGIGSCAVSSRYRCLYSNRGPPKPERCVGRVKRWAPERCG